ncbi:uncharacterized protein BJ171DRAFT_567042 [Polychytrium aggregatum]|uniref:uncharacterized protein n=1 Tax=Polychytrium aggregatum TaxID=110093 RepID=UPI0022FDF7B8|nr:uncharacterized protein BJ171DRAFT_567042 [Polychytrium aggregatum]KAI9206242.1 hypothetical protein BJ171DRAFT_567042 [Polychytrium aggregatum]
MASGWEKFKSHTRRMSDTFSRRSVPDASSPGSPSKATPAIAELLKPIYLTLNEAELVHDTEEWRYVDERDNVGVFGRVKELERENRQLRLKIDVLLDLLTISKLDNVALHMERGD